jgi:hypothetical protein
LSRRTLLALVVLVCGALFAAIQGLPFFSEDFTQLLEKSRLAGLREVLDLSLDPLRPFQHVAYYILSRCADPDPAWLRALAVLLHGGSALLVVRLARGLGAEEREARLCGALFLVFPGVKLLVWGAAISNPLRVFFVLAALVAFAERRSLLIWLCYLLALCSYECAIVVPLMFALLALARGERQRLRDPQFLGCVLLTVAYVVYIYARPQRHDQLKPLDSIPANLVKAALSLAPESLRSFCVECFRGHLGVGLSALAIALFLGWLALWVWALLRGGPALRFVVLAIALDFVLPVLSAGFVQRYAYLAGAFAAVGVVLASGRLKPRPRMALLALAFAAWSWDTLRDTYEYREAGALQQRIIQQLRSERARAGPTQLVAVIELPDMAGSEHDLPLFNWGAEECLKRAHVAGPWVFWRTREYATGSDIPLLPPQHLQNMTEHGIPVLWYHPAGADEALPLRRLTD